MESLEIAQAAEGPARTTALARRRTAKGNRRYRPGHSRSDAGGETFADALTIIETAKLSGLNPEAYLAVVLARINDHPNKRLDDLLPWNWQPANC
ncbi:hypothetical protein DRB17_19605 [Ferruginivarius sediminum]|uniref:Transposase IS66 C-terminal domain-containing protein n=1 Tax=Ferruginivarius sediminum TaxID=2661937 RepID=A0A369T712_9PROT|nr:hypothetical protein DRB17_19605 [Ferruginivarius sediminum]